MRGSGAWLAVRGSGARLGTARRVAQLAVRGSSARRNTSAQKKTVRMLAFWNRQAAAPAPVPAQVPAAEARADLTTVVGLLVSTLTIIMFLQGFITTKLEITNTKLEKLDTISKDVAANNNKLDTLNEKLQTEQVQVSDLKGQVGVLRDVVTGTTTATPTEKK